MQDITIKGVKIQYDKTNVRIIDSYKVKRKRHERHIILVFIQNRVRK